MKALLFIAASLLFFGCGNPTSNGGAVTGVSQVKLYLFGAPNCQGCDTEIPQIQQTLKDKLGDRYGHLSVKVYVLNGNNNVAPNAQIAQDYKAGFARSGKPVDFDFVPDGWIHKTYRSYYPDRHGQDTIPAAVVAGADDKSIIAFTPGSVSPDQVADFINARLN